MPKKRPRSPDDEPHSPTVAEIIEQSSRVWENGHLQTAWNLVADVTVSDSGDLLALVVAIGCLCQELAEITEEDLDRPDPDGPVH